VCKPGRKVLVLDGDGAALMKLGTLATIGHYAPGNLLHVVLDNAVHDSTGAQATVSPTVDFAGVAAACNYRNVWSVSEPRDLAEAVTRGQELPGPNFVHVRTVPGSPPDLPRPHHTPVEIKERFMAFLASR
jgi:phosphonopyruvate decarboxylase